ncbi:hypothetical protein EDB84DRAFT_1441233 [Lactarius hengduanensis]|nr:hypothetical protein EDB84DRAFT_1441233 [Lactarius hengduanensis]
MDGNEQRWHEEMHGLPAYEWPANCCLQREWCWRRSIAMQKTTSDEGEGVSQSESEMGSFGDKPCVSSHRREKKGDSEVVNTWEKKFEIRVNLGELGMCGRSRRPGRTETRSFGDAQDTRTKLNESEERRVEHENWTRKSSTKSSDNHEEKS